MPATVKREEHGFIHGKVVAVSELPATRLAMEAALQHPDLVEAFLKRYAPGVLLRVHVKLGSGSGRRPQPGYGDHPAHAQPLQVVLVLGSSATAQDGHHVRGRNRRQGAAVDHPGAALDQESLGMR